MSVSIAYEDIFHKEAKKKKTVKTILQAFFAERGPNSAALV